MAEMMQRYEFEEFIRRELSVGDSVVVTVVEGLFGEEEEVTLSITQIEANAGDPGDYVKVWLAREPGGQAPDYHIGMGGADAPSPDGQKTYSGYVLSREGREDVRPIIRLDRGETLNIHVDGETLEVDR